MDSKMNVQTACFSIPGNIIKKSRCEVTFKTMKEKITIYHIWYDFQFVIVWKATYRITYFVWKLVDLKRNVRKLI